MLHTNKHKTYRRHRRPNTLNALELADAVKRTAGGESIDSVAKSYGCAMTSLKAKLNRFQIAYRGAERQLTFI